MIDVVLVTLLIMVAAPITVYASVKLGRFAWLRATHLFYLHHEEEVAKGKSEFPGSPRAD